MKHVSYRLAFLLILVCITMMLSVFAGAAYMAEVMDGYESNPETRSEE